MMRMPYFPFPSSWSKYMSLNGNIVIYRKPEVILVRGFSLLFFLRGLFVCLNSLFHADEIPQNSRVRFLMEDLTGLVSPLAGCWCSRMLSCRHTAPPRHQINWWRQCLMRSIKSLSMRAKGWEQSYFYSVFDCSSVLFLTHSQHVIVVIVDTRLGGRKFTSSTFSSETDWDYLMTLAKISPLSASR